MYIKGAKSQKKRATEIFFFKENFNQNAVKILNKNRKLGITRSRKPILHSNTNNLLQFFSLCQPQNLAKWCPWYTLDQHRVLIPPPFIEQELCVLLYHKCFLITGKQGSLRLTLPHKLVHPQASSGGFTEVCQMVLRISRRLLCDRHRGLALDAGAFR